MATSTKLISRREAHRAKVTVTLHPERVRYADRKAQERGLSRSEVIDVLLAEAEERETSALMIAGYRAMANENVELAEEGLESFGEILEEDGGWPDTPERQDVAG